MKESTIKKTATQVESIIKDLDIQHNIFHEDAKALNKDWKELSKDWDTLSQDRVV